MKKNSVVLQTELEDLIKQAGGDQEASDLISQLCGGIAPDRSTIGKMRRGEGGLSYKALVVFALQQAITLRT